MWEEFLGILIAEFEMGIIENNENYVGIIKSSIHLSNNIETK